MKTRRLEVTDYSQLKTITIKIDPSFHKRLKTYSFKHDISMTWILEEGAKLLMERKIK